MFFHFFIPFLASIAVYLLIFRRLSSFLFLFFFCSFLLGHVLLHPSFASRHLFKEHSSRYNLYGVKEKMIICFYLLYVKNADMLSLYIIGIKSFENIKMAKMAYSSVGRVFYF